MITTTWMRQADSELYVEMPRAENSQNFLDISDQGTRTRCFYVFSYRERQRGREKAPSSMRHEHSTVLPWGSGFLNCQAMGPDQTFS